MISLFFAPLVLVAQAPDAAIQKLVAETAAAYRSATALSLVVETAQGTNKTTTQLTLLKTGKLAATITSGTTVRRVVADGTSVYSDSAADKTKYVKQPAKNLQEAIGVLGMSGGLGVGLLPILLTSPEAEKQMIPGKPSSLTKGALQTVDGVPCEVVTAILGDAQQKSAFRFFIGKKDHFLQIGRASCRERVCLAV